MLLLSLCFCFSCLFSTTIGWSPN